MTHNLAIGCDIGGTKIASGIVNTQTGAIIATTRKKTKASDNDLDLVKKIENSIDELLLESKIKTSDITAIGLGIAGMVDRSKGILLEAANIKTGNLSITEPISQKFKIPAYLGNDVEVATIGEMHFGAGQNCENFHCIFVGTGIGSGLVINNKLIQGFTGTAGEIGHIMLIPNGKICGCGNYGCLEAYASRLAISKNILKYINKGYETCITDKIDLDKGILRSKAITDAISKNDKVVINCVLEASNFLAMGISSVLNLINPEKIILGGGLIDVCDLYFQNFCNQLKYYSLKIPGKKTIVQKAQIGDFAGIIGAAKLTQFYL